MPSADISREEVFAMAVNEIDKAVQKLITMTEEKVESELIWENASPTSSFAAQTLDDELTELPKSNDIVIIKWRHVADSKAEHMTLTSVGSEDYAGFVQMAENAGGYNGILQRSFSISTTGITFKTCKYKANNVSTAAAANNAYLIPYEIFIIKGVQ